MQQAKTVEMTIESATSGYTRDWELVCEARAGSSTAFDVLFHRHKSFVYNVCYRMLGSADEAVDATQAAFIEAYKAIRKFRGDSGFRSWLYRIAVNLCNGSRRADRQQETCPGQRKRGVLRSAALEPRTRPCRRYGY